MRNSINLPEPRIFEIKHITSSTSGRLQTPQRNIGDPFEGEIGQYFVLLPNLVQPHTTILKSKEKLKVNTQYQWTIHPPSAAVTMELHIS
jgi:hypothetical protein